MADLFDRWAPLMAQRDALFGEGINPFNVVMDDVLAGVFANLSLQLIMLIWGIS